MNLNVTPVGRGRGRSTVGAGEQMLSATFEIQTYVAKTAPPPLPGATGAAGQ